MAEVRDATRHDAHAIATVLVASWRTAYQGLMPDEVLAGLSIPAREQFWFDVLSAPPPRTTTLLATMGATVLGFASSGPPLVAEDSDPATGDLYAIYVDPDVWGHGVGAQLHATALRRLRSGGFDRAGLWVLEGNERALRFYRREGWIDAGRSRIDADLIGVELVEHRLHRDLTTE